MGKFVRMYGEVQGRKPHCYTNDGTRTAAVEIQRSMFCFCCLCQQGLVL